MKFSCCIIYNLYDQLFVTLLFLWKNIYLQCMSIYDHSIWHRSIYSPNSHINIYIIPEKVSGAFSSCGEYKEWAVICAVIDWCCQVKTSSGIGVGFIYKTEYHGHILRQGNDDDVIMGAMASQLTDVSIVCSTVCSGANRRKHQSSASVAFARPINRWPMDSPHKGPVTRKMFPFDEVIMT